MNNSNNPKITTDILKDTFYSLTLVLIRKWAKSNSIRITSKYTRKADIIDYLLSKIDDNSFDLLVVYNDLLGLKSDKKKGTKVKEILLKSIDDSDSITMEYLSSLTIPKIKEEALSYGVKIPSGFVKKGMIDYFLGKLEERRDGVYTPENTKIDLEELTPVYMPDEPEDWDSETPFWLDHFFEHGWTVVPVPNWDNSYENSFFNYIESFCPNFVRDDYSTWKRVNMPVHLHGIYKNYFGHTDFQWKIRELVSPIFAEIWNCEKEDLLSSMGSAGLIPPPTRSKSGKCKLDNYNNWFHSDFPRNYVNFDDGYTITDIPYIEYKGKRISSIQGIVNYTDNGPNDGGFTFIEGSLDVYLDYLNKYKSYGYKWGTLNIEDPLLKNKRRCKLCLKAGEMILFDSRIFHCNSPPRVTNSHRMCSYVAMMPRRGADEKTLKKRIKAYKKGTQTDHWCYGEWFGVRPLHPRTYGNDINQPKEIVIPELNYLCRRFVGFDD